MNRIGLDAHSASFTLAVVNEAQKVTKCVSRPMSAENLITEVSQVPGPRLLIVEESGLGQWVKDTLGPYVDELVVCDPRRNRWIAGAEYNDDKTSAVKLAQLSWGGYLKEVVHLDEEQAQLRGLFRSYADLNEQLTRFKNKLKALYRQVGIAPTGPGIYDPKARPEWLLRLAGQPAARQQARQYFRLLELLEQMKQETLKAMVRRARRQPAYACLLTIPGVGPALACGYLALLGTAARFSRKNKLWRYAGLANTRHLSDDVVYQDRPSKSGNRLLKWVVRQHFMGAVARARQPNIFCRRYERLCQHGLGKPVARRHVSRSLLSVVRAVWLKGEAYRELPLT